MTIQVVSHWFSPYFISTENAKTINESNNFRKQVNKACQRAANSVGNTVLLNNSTDRASGETSCNFSTMIDYLEGRSVTKELIRVEDFASVAMVLCLACAATIKKTMALDMADSGSQAICGIDEKHHNYVDTVFKGGLKTCRSNKESHRYQETFGESFDTIEEQVEVVKDFFSSKLSTETGNASAADRNNDEDSDTNGTDNEMSNDSHKTNITEESIKCMVSSLQNTSKESRIGACNEPEEETEEVDNDKSFNTTMESFFEGNNSLAMKELGR
eukprot:11930384-Ditylum_brightwellii.AAC.1